MNSTVWAGITAASLLAASAGGAADSPQAMAALVVDAGHAAGSLKTLRGVNGAPDSSFLSHTGMLGEMPAVNVSAGYRAAHITLVRTHDSDGAADLDTHTGALPSPLGPAAPPAAAAAQIDMNVLFPDLAADPDDPHSYHFGPTDQLIAGIRAIGADVLFRLGRSGMTTAPPPTDLKRYADIIRHVVLHYNHGWDDGLKEAVRYWEVWNEPDLGKIFWNGTPEQYDALYAAAVRAVKAADPTALVGGPTIALVNEPSPYREGFLSFVRAQHLPLDFFSWHWYSVDADDPLDFALIGQTFRQQLNQYGFQHTQSFLDEWNYDFTALRAAAPIQVASFITSALIYLQDAPVDQTALYRGDTEFDASGQPRTAVGQALIEIGRFADTPKRLSTRGADRNGLAVQAARSGDGTMLRVLVSNYQIPTDKMGVRPQGDVMHEHGLFNLQLLHRRTVSYPASRHYRLDLQGLPAGRYQVLHRRIGEVPVPPDTQTLDTRHPTPMVFDLPAYVIDSFEVTPLH